MKTQIIENSDEIILRYVPVKEWVWGVILFFTSAIFCVWLIYSYFINPYVSSDLSAKDWRENLPFILFLVTASVFAFSDINLKSIFFASLTSVIINQKTFTVDVFQKRFYGATTRRIYFHQIEKFKSYREKRNYLVFQGDEKFYSKYCLVLILANKKEIKSPIPISEDKNETVKFIKRLNKFIKSKNVLPKDDN